MQLSYRRRLYQAEKPVKILIKYLMVKKARKESEKERKEKEMIHKKGEERRGEERRGEERRGEERRGEEGCTCSLNCSAVGSMCGRVVFLSHILSISEMKRYKKIYK